MREQCVSEDAPQKKENLSGWLMYLVIAVGLAARMMAAGCGHNYDLESYQIVSKIMDHGGNVYAETARYNYGPIWFYVLHALQMLAWHHQEAFRYLLAGFLSLVDVGIFYVLWQQYGKVAAVAFFLNPISVIITGYHNQFDNLAIFLGMVSVLLMKDEFDKPVGGRKFFGLVVLGLSLVTKHVLFAFPFWLAVKQKGLWQKVIVASVPVLIFLISFAPYWHEGQQGIIANVFQYKSLTNEYFYTTFVPLGLQFMFSSRAIWLFGLAGFAFISRKKKVMESLLIYTCVLVATSPSITNQYLAIPVPFVATHLNVMTILFTVTGLLRFLVNVNGFGLHLPVAGYMQDVPIYFLIFGLIWVTWRAQITALIKRCAWEIENQWSSKE